MLLNVCMDTESHCMTQVARQPHNPHTRMPENHGRHTKYKGQLNVCTAAVDIAGSTQATRTPSHYVFWLTTQLRHAAVSSLQTAQLLIRLCFIE
jgi:hypothetical protein